MERLRVGILGFGNLGRGAAAAVSQLILPGTYNTDYTIDHTGRQCPV